MSERPSPERTAAVCERAEDSIRAALRDLRLAVDRIAAALDVLAGSSSDRTAAFEAENPGSNPGPAVDALAARLEQAAKELDGIRWTSDQHVAKAIAAALAALQETPPNGETT